MAWVYLLLAGTMEIVATTLYRYSDGLARPVPVIGVIAAGVLSFYFLQRSLAGIPLGTAYAVWTGIGAAGTAVLGMALYGEPSTGLRIVLLVVLVGAIAGLNLAAHE